MRILLLGINYWPEKTGIAPYNTRRCEHLAASGHDVTAVTAVPYYPEWRIADEYRRRPWRREQRAGVEILRSPLFVPRRVTSFKRLVHEATFAASALLRSQSARRPDLIFVVSPPLGLSLVARILARRWRVPYVFQVEDLQPDAAADLGMLRGRWLLRTLYWVERSAYRRAALVSTLTSEMAERIRSKGIPGEKVRIFPHWVDGDLLSLPEDGVAELRRKLALGDRFLVLHAGNMGVKQGLGVVLEAALRLRDRPDVLFLLVGDGAERESLQARAQELRLENVRFLPLLPDEDFRCLLAAAGVALVVQQRTVADIVFPSKVVALLSAGLPVLASVSKGSAVAGVVRESGGGVVVEPEEGQAMAEAAVAMHAAEDERRSMGERGRAYAFERWSPERALGAMEEGLRSVVGGSGEARPTRLSGHSDRSTTESARRES